MSTSRTSIARLLIHVGMMCAALAFASWWMSNTLLDTGRTARITDAALSNAAFRGFVADRIASVTASSLGGVPAPTGVSPAPGVGGGTPPGTAASNEKALATNVADVLARPDIRTHLETFVDQAHDLLVGRSHTPATLDADTVRTVVAAALPSTPPAQLARLSAITFSVPKNASLDAGREAFAHRFPLYALGAIILVGLAIVLTDDRHATVKTVGTWLLGISVAHLVVLWLVPVVIVPAVTTNPWAGLVAAVFRVVSAALVTGLIVLAGLGVAFRLADHWIPVSRSAPVSPPGESTAETILERMKSARADSDPR